jgi:radical SAM/Cys-rich protein
MVNNEFDKRVDDVTRKPLCCESIDILQVNVGFRCNQACEHCHLKCSPERRESMAWSTMELIVDIARHSRPTLVDITGGSPELNPSLTRFIEALKADGHDVQVRTNLTVFMEPGMERMPEFLREYGVKLVASLPCYLQKNVCAQRGEGVYERSIETIRKLNVLGYGEDPSLQLRLVYNPGGPFLPPDQSSLESDYRRELGAHFGIKFTDLITIANMPIGRFSDHLKASGELEGYLNLLKESFNPKTVDGLMCRHQVSVGWDGALYDCDFNLALGMAVDHGAPNRIEDFDLSSLRNRRVMTGMHCFGCTAGCGSSCVGALAKGE